MPLYEYKCNGCGHEFEELVSYSRADAVACEKCGSKQTVRLVSTFAASGEEGNDVPTCFSGG